MSHDADLVAKVAEALNEEGAAPGSSLHSWRCEYPDRYGPCTCVDETARAVLDALDLPGLIRAAKAEAWDAGVLVGLAAYSIDDHDPNPYRAAKIDPEEGDQ